MNGVIVPYEIVHRGNKWLVKKPGIFGRVFGKHDTKESAERQREAIEANEHRKRK